MATDNQGRRVLPQSDLDFSLMTTDSVWGKAEVPPELRTKLGRYFMSKNKDGTQLKDDEGNPVATFESLWGLLGFYTRDVRLANLSSWNGEVEYCQYFLDLAGDFLQEDQIEPFLICLKRVATILELSQSKGGFLRRRMNTFTQESNTFEKEPPKKSLFGTGKNNRAGGIK